MSGPTSPYIIGGNGGSSFDFTGSSNGATLRKIEVAEGGWQIKAVRAELTDGRVETFGKAHTFQEYTFEHDERITKLSLWDNGEASRLGAIRFWTSSGGEFFAKMTDWELQTEYSIDVGSGVCLGVEGRAGLDIDSMGFLFINAIQSSVLTDMTYPSLAMTSPQVVPVNMSAPTTLSLIGGNGGSPFEFTGRSNGATLRKIGVAVGGCQIKAVRAELSDGRVQTFGNAHTFKEYTFEHDERITKLSLWDDGAGTRLGAIRFWTSSGGEFFAKMTDCRLQTEYSIDVGSGVCLGVVGRAGLDIDCIGFLFINDIQSSEQTQVVPANMSGPTSPYIIGGNGGSEFDFTGRSNGATLRKIGVAVGSRQIKAVRAELTDGRVQTFGDAHIFKEYTFKHDERITKLFLWDNGAGTRLGAIRFWTSSGGEFFAKMTDLGLQTEHSIDVGSGVCLGVVGKAGSDIDCMGFLFINAIQSSVLTDMTYPSLAMTSPQVVPVNMSGPTTLYRIGGNGGSPFDFTGRSNGATLRKIGVAVGFLQIKAVRVELSDGRVETFGNAHTFKEYTFEHDERITKMSLWNNCARTRLGAIRFWTSSGGEFFAKIRWGLKTEYSINVGSGVCLGVEGRAGSDIDCMGFLFINAIQSSVLTDMTYRSLATCTPQVQTEHIKSVSYNNDTTEDQEHTCQYSRSVTKSTTWSTTTKIESTVSMTVKAGIPKLGEVSGGFSLTMGASQTSSTTNTETITESDSVKVKVPAGKRVSVEVSVGRAVLDLEYSAKVKITCRNGSELVFDSTGQYNGVAYTAVNVKTTQSDL